MYKSKLFIETNLIKNPNSKKIFNFISGKLKENVDIITISTESGSTLTLSIDIANEFNEYFSSVFNLSN